jgi:hypothetical protein
LRIAERRLHSRRHARSERAATECRDAETREERRALAGTRWRENHALILQTLHRARQ